MNEKDKNINYIKEVKRLTSLKTICEELNINSTNVTRGTTSESNIEKVVLALKENIKTLNEMK